MTFAGQLKFYRQELDLTQAELSELLDVPKRTLWDWESGKTEPLPVAQEGTLARLQQALQLASLRNRVHRCRRAHEF
jgi:DNA-binding transcriptional regulator YiaG